MSASHDHDGHSDGTAPPAARTSKKRNRRQRRAAPATTRRQDPEAPAIDAAPAGESAASEPTVRAAEPTADKIDAEATIDGAATSVLTATHNVTYAGTPEPAPIHMSPLPRVRRAQPRRTIRLTSEQLRGNRAEVALPVAAMPAVKPDMLVLTMMLLTLVLAGTAGSLYFRIGSAPTREMTPSLSAIAVETPAGAAAPPSVPPAQAGAPRSNPLDDYRQGLRYALGNGVPRDYGKAAELLLKAALQGVPDAQYNLGALYANGLGVPRDPQRAATWYQAAAQQQHPLAAFNLALAYVDGSGVEQSDTEAARWFRRAAQQGVANAQFDLAALYLSGRGVPRSTTEAYAWFSILAASGDKEASQQVDRLTATMSRQDLSAARERTQRLAEIVNRR